MPSLGAAARVNVRIYFEGKLIPSAGASVMVHGATGAPLTFQLSLVPSNSIKHIMAGTWIHVFATDPWDPAPRGDLSDFKLLCEGVVVDRGFSKQDGGRHFVVQCADPSIYWTEAKQFWINLTSAGGAMVDQLTVQTSDGRARFGTLTSNGLYGYMHSKLASIEEGNEERFLDTMIGVIDDIGNVNPFYQNVRNRFRITDRIMRASAGRTEELFHIALVSDLLDSIASRASGSSNLLEIVNSLLDVIMHEWVSIPAPPYVEARIFSRDQFGAVKRDKKTVSIEDTTGKRQVELFELEPARDKIIAGLFFKPHIYSLSPPSCNVLFPNMYDNFSFNQGFLGEPTRVKMIPQMFMRNLESVTSQLYMLRPTELEIFTSLTRDPVRGANGLRTPDAKIGDGAGQTPVFHDYDWVTNEERIRGIVYNEIRMAPAPATLALSDPGVRQPNGTRKGGMPKYLQNVASYEHFKAKFASRQQALSGPFNMHPVPGFSILALDDSAANMNLVAYLDSITHNIDAAGSATTQYGLKYPRLVDEVDFNRPRFKGGQSAVGELDLGLLRDDNGQYSFDRMFESPNRPPIPEWFSEDFTTLTGLNLTYRKWLGDNVRVIESLLFDDPEKSRAALNETFPGLGDLSAAGVSGMNDKIDQISATRELNRRFRDARASGREFELASAFTNRTFTRIDEAFRFVGASPIEYADPLDDGTVDTEAGLRSVKFSRSPSAGRKVDYVKDRLDVFAGDASTGSGYAAIPEGNDSTSQQIARMSGAFPVFDTKIHQGMDVTDQATRTETARAEGGRSSYARYDGRPIMFDVEFRLWQESLRAAGVTPTGEERDDYIDYTVVDAGAVRPATPEEKAANATARLAAIKAKATAAAADASKGKKSPKQKTSHTGAEQAPTGDELEEEKRLPLPQPLSEKQVIDLRRAIVDAYRQELEQSRGFTG